MLGSQQPFSKVSVIVDIGVGGGRKPAFIDFQESFSLATCLQGFLRNGGDQLSGLPRTKVFPMDVVFFNDKFGTVLDNLDDRHPRIPALLEGLQVAPVSLPPSV